MMIRRCLMALLVGLFAAMAAVHPAVAQDQDRAARYPNEPEGFEPWFVHDWQSFPETHDGASSVAASDKGYFILSGVSAHVERATLIDDPDAPHGFGKSLRVHWPADFRRGRGFFNYAIRSTDVAGSDAMAASVPLQKWYISTWVLLEADGPDGLWEMNANQLRHFTANRHITGGQGRTIFGWTMRGDSIGDSGMDYSRRSERMRDYRLWGYRAPGGSSQTFASVNPGLPVGEWVHMELLFDRTVKAPPLFSRDEDGVGPVHFKVWANGELIEDRVIDDVWMSHPFMELFFNLNQSTGDNPSVDKYLRLSGTYISGELYTEQRP